MVVRRSSLAALCRVLLSAAVPAAALALLSVGPGHAYASDLGGGSVYQRDYKWSFPRTSAATASSGSNNYIVYTPTGWTPTERLPLYVLLHGCPAIAGQGADATMQATRVNPIADSQRFVVLYPDNHASCWHASSPGRESSVRGGGGDADIVAGMTREVMSAFNVDTERVYIIGFSSGSSQASATGYAYPDLYAAVGVNSGSGPNMDTTCNAMSDDTAPFFAETTVEQMGPRARPMPFFGIGGDGLLGGEEDYGKFVDPTGLHPKVSGCTRIAYLEALAIDQLLLPGHDFKTSFSRTGHVTAAEDGTPVHGEPYERMVALDGAGCPIAENWVVGTGHFWMGGSADPQYTKYGINDIKAPSSGANSWAFFRQFTLHGGNTSCKPTTPQKSPTPTPGPYSATASALLISSDAVSLPGQLRAPHLDVATATATVDSAAPRTDPRAVAAARNLTLSDAVTGVNHNLLMEAQQAAPTSETSPVHRQLAAVPAAPYLNADLATADAAARWNGPSCVTDQPITTAKTTLANAQVEPYGASDGGTNWQGSLVGMDNYIAPSGTATSTGTVSLTRHTTDARYSFDVTATTQVSGINVYDAAYIDVVAAPTAEVIATGIPGTARAVIQQPVLRVQGATLASGRTFTTGIAGGPVIQITPGKISANLAADGTAVIASGALAHIKVLDVTGTITLADVTIGNLAATANVPKGGVTCPRSPSP